MQDEGCNGELSLYNKSSVGYSMLLFCGFCYTGFGFELLDIPQHRV